MPNNDNNPFKELPKLNDDTEQGNNFATPNTTSSSEPSKPIIEIPQEYYDKLDKEKKDREAAEQLMQAHAAERAELTSRNNNLFMMAVVNALAIYGIYYAAINVHHLFILAIPAFIIVFSIIIGLKDKTESQYPQSVMVGGIIVGIITFIMSAAVEGKADFYTTYALVSTGTGFLGLIVGSVINKIINDHENIKAIESLGYILFFAALIVIPYYLSEHYHEAFYKYLFNEQVEVKAETEDEYIIKTLKIRYNQDFQCDSKTVKKHIDEHQRIFNERLCYDSSNRKVIVTSTPYNESEVKYIVKDDYVDTLLVTPVKESVASSVKKVSGASEVLVSLYPKDNCYFYGDCVQWEDYKNNYQKINNPDNLYQISVKNNFTKYIGTEAKTFINENNFRYFINVRGSYDSDKNYTTLVNDILSTLNHSNLKNNYGYSISFYNVDGKGDDALITLVYQVEGNMTEDLSFKNPKIVDISASYQGKK